MAGFHLTLDNLRSWCERQQLQYKLNPDLGQLAVLYRLLDQETPLLIIPMGDRGMVTFGVALPFAVPVERRAKTAHALTLLNGSSYMGAWILNLESGQLYFRVTVPAMDTAYTDPGLLFVARVVISTAEAVAAKLRDVALGDGDPTSVVPPPAFS